MRISKFFGFALLASLLSMSAPALPATSYDSPYANVSAIVCATDQACALIGHIRVQAVTFNSIAGSGLYTWQNTCSSTPDGVFYVRPAGTHAGCFKMDGFASSVAMANAGANSNITSLSGLTTPLSFAQGGTGNNTPYFKCVIDATQGIYGVALGNSAATNAAKLQAALNDAMAAGCKVSLRSAGITSSLANAYPMANITYDLAKTSLDCGGASLNFTGLSGAGTYALMLTTSLTVDVNQQLPVHNAHPMEDCWFVGPAASSGVYGIGFTPVTIAGAPWFVGGVFNRVGGSGFAALFRTGAGAFFQTWNDGYYGTDSLTSGAYVSFGPGANSLEKEWFNNVHCINVLSCFIDNSSNTVGDIFINGMSCDGAQSCITGQNIIPDDIGVWASFHWHLGHLESPQGTNYIINSGAGGILLDSVDLVGGASSITHAYCNSTGNSYSPGVKFNNVTFVSNNNTFVPGGSDYFCDGNGPFSSSGGSQFGNTPVVLASRGGNKFPAMDAPDPIYFTSASAQAVVDTSTLPPSETLTGTVTASSYILTALSTNPITAGIKTGSTVAGTGIPAGTTVTGLTSTTITLSAPGSSTGSARTINFDVVAQSLKLPTSAANQLVTFNTSCGIARTAFATMKYLMPGALVGYAYLYYIDSKGNSLGLAAAPTLTNSASWQTLQMVVTANGAPPGTTNVQLQIGDLTGTGLAMNVARIVVGCD